MVRISDKAITYADEFKKLFIDQSMVGKLPREIFEGNGFDVNVIGMQRVKQLAERWRRAYELSD
ncbi:HTH domain-containing protein [Paenibacillus lignilyticus]|uniref:HTH domain-containing protein n=1 Tax=Paenibacillus lignilyticus TaxID=1172615 RepID=UPI003B833538